jgi:hypothetical protein
VASIRMQTFNSWVVTCGSCAQNPGTFVITQPDPAAATYLEPKEAPPIPATTRPRPHASAHPRRQAGLGVEDAHLRGTVIPPRHRLPQPT